MCELTPNLVGPRTDQGYAERLERIPAVALEMSQRLISRVRILTSGTGLPLKWSGDSGQRLYAISEHGGLLRTNRAVTTCSLPHRPWDIRKMKVTLSIDTTPMLLITTIV